MMLIQTTVTAVIPFFERFVNRFPTAEALALAKESDVLKAWEGLGYYRRTRQLHAAARLIVAEHGGRIPDDPKAVRALPGVRALHRRSGPFVGIQSARTDCRGEQPTRARAPSGSKARSNNRCRERAYLGRCSAVGLPKHRWDF